MNFKNLTLSMLLTASLLANAEISANDSQQKGSTGHEDNLDMRLSNGEAEGYAFIKQIFPREKTLPAIPALTIELEAEDPFLPFDWVWQVKSFNENALKASLTFDWYGQASCPGSLEDLSIDGPGGAKSQNPLTNPIWGYFKYQGFSVDTVVQRCEDWANDNNCDPKVPGCVQQVDFNLVGGAALAPNDLVHLTAKCDSGIVADEKVAPIMTLKCIRNKL